MLVPDRPRPIQKMPIFSKEPSDWQGLQNRVQIILRESGYEAECDKRIKTVRGSRNVDVYAEHLDASRAPAFAMICECKHWAKRVPRQVVDAFQTLLTGAGANIGYIISKEGFQRGAIEAADHTAIKLLTYRQFEGELFLQWHRHQKAVLSSMVRAAWDYVDKVNPERDMYARSKPALMSKIRRLWRRSQILRDAGWVSSEHQIFWKYRGPKPGNYKGHDQQLDINGVHDYITEIGKTCAWIRKEVEGLGTQLIPRVYVNGRALSFARALQEF